ncbi:MAG: pilus assembly protein PilM, partial [Thermodesulfovibrionales bacterium]
MAEAILKINRIISWFGNISEAFVRLLGRFLKVLAFSPFEEGFSFRKAMTLSIERGSVSVAYGSSIFSKLKVRSLRYFNYDEERFPSPDELATAASIVLGHLKKKPDVTLIIPKSWAVLKIAEFPITVKENLQNVLSFEMDRLTPFNPEDVFYDYRIIREEDNRLSLLIAATKKDTVIPYIEALQEKGIDVKRITVSMTAMAALNFYSGGKGSTIFLDMGKNFYEAGLLEGSVTVDHTSGSFETEDDDKTRTAKVVKELQPFFERVKSSGSTPEILLLRDSSIKETLRSMINYPLRILGETDLKIKLPTIQDSPYVALGGLVESLIRGERINLLSYG